MVWWDYANASSEASSEEQIEQMVNETIHTISMRRYIRSKDLPEREPFGAFTILIIFYDPSFVIEISVMFLLEQMGQDWILLLILVLSSYLKTVILHKQVSQTTNWQLILPYIELWIWVLGGDIKECMFHIWHIYNNCRIWSYRLIWSTIVNLLLMSIITINQNVTINYAHPRNHLGQ